MTSPVMFFNDIRQDEKKLIAIIIISVNTGLSVAARGYVIKGARINDAKWPSHALILSQITDLTPSEKKHPHKEVLSDSDYRRPKVFFFSSGNIPILSKYSRLALEARRAKAEAWSFVLVGFLV